MKGIVQAKPKNMTMVEKGLTMFENQKKKNLNSLKVVL